MAIDFKESTGIAFQALRANKLRSLLTLLGTIIGVTAVIAVISLVQGMNQYVSGKLLAQGSNVFWIPSSINNQPCPAGSNVDGFLCPSPPFGLALTVAGRNAAMASAPISVVDPRTLFTSSSLTAFNNIAAPNTEPNGIALGLPFFFGRNVFTAIEGAATPGGTGPYVAF